MRRRLLRIVLWMALGLGLIVASTALVVETPWFKDQVRRIAIERTAKYLNGKLTIGRVSGSLLRGVKLEDVALVQDGRPVIRAAEILVQYDPWVLIHRHVTFEQITIRNASVIVIQDARGWNLARLVTLTPSQGPPVDFLFSRIELINGDVQLEMQGRPARHIGDVQADLRLSRATGVIAVTIARLTAADDRSGYRVNELAGSFKGALEELDLKFAAQSATASASGAITSGNHDAGGLNRLAGSVDLVHFDLSPVIEDTRWRTDVSGHATFAGSLAAAPENEGLTFAFAGPHASALGYEGQNLNVTGRYTGGRVDFTGTGSGYGATASVTGRWTEGRTARDAASFLATGAFRSLDLRRLPRSLAMPQLAGTLSGRFRTTVHGSSFTGDVTLNQSTLVGATLGAGTVGHVESDGRTIRYRAQGDIAQFNPQSIAAPLNLPALAAPRYAASLTGSFVAEGEEPKSGDRTLSATAHLVNSTMAGASVGAMDARVALNGQQLDVTANGDFTHVTNELAGLPADVPVDLTGTADVTLRIADLRAPVTPTSMDVNGRVHLTNSTVRAVTIREASVDGALAGGVATLTDAKLDAVGLKAAGRGTVALGPDGSSNMSVTIGADDLKAVGDLLGQPLTGAADVEATITGPADALHAEGTIKARQLAYSTTAAALTLNSSFAADVANRQWAQATVRGDSEATFVKVSGVDIVRLTAKSTYANNEIDVETHIEETSRAVDAAGTVRLNDSGRDVTLRSLALSASGATWQLAPGTEARITLTDETICVDGLSLQNNGQQIDVAGTIARETPTPEAPGITVDVRDVRVAELNKLAMGTRPIDGALNAHMAVTGSIAKPAVAGDFTIADGTVEQVHYDALRGTARFVPGRLDLDARLDQDAANHLTITGVVPVATPANEKPADLDVRVSSDAIELGLLQAFTTEVTKVSGIGVLDLRVTGQPSAANVNGTVQLKGAGFMVPATGINYKNIAADLRFEGQRLQVASFQGEDDDKHLIKIAGGLGILGEAAGTDVDVTVTGDDVHVLRNTFGNVQLDINMRLTGSLAEPKLAGDLRVDQGRIEVDRVLETTTKNVYSTEPQAALGAEAPKKPGLFDRLDLALKVTMPDNLVMRGRDLRVGDAAMGLGDMNIVAGGSLDVKKPAGGSTTVLGSVQIIRGYYSFQGRKFEVERDSTVRFRGADITDPALDLTASQEISGVSTSVQLQGTAQRPTVRLSSSPPLDDADILSLIVFGQPVNDLGTSERTSLTEKAGALAAGAIATPVADSVARALNLDLFEIQAPSSDQKAPVVSVGSQVGTRLYVAVRQAIGHDESSAVSVEYKIANFVRLVTTIAQGSLQERAFGRAQAGGVDLIFVFRY